MSLTQLDTQNADLDLTSQVTVLTHTPSATVALQCQGYVAFGDGSKDLGNTGGDFEVTIMVDGQTIEPDPQVVTFSTATRTGVWTTPFPVPANSEVVIKVLSPNAGDSDVDVTAYLYEIPMASANDSADAVLGRSVSNVETTAAEHSLCSLVLAVFESSIAGTVWTIKQTDGSTAHLVKTVSVDSNADPIIGVE